MSTRQTLAAVGVAAAIAGLGGAAVYAATDTDRTGHHGPPGGPPGPPPAMASGPAADPATVHGEFVLADGNGGYTTTVTQTGEITDLSPNSVTMRSTDGFAQTYALPAAARPPLARNDTVLIQATRTGATLAVTSIGAPARP